MHTKNKYVYPSLAPLITTLIIAGCDDGSSSTSTNPASATDTETRITTESAKPIAAAALASVDTVQGLPVRGGTVRSRSDDSTADEFNYSDFVVNKLAFIQQESLLMGSSTQASSSVTANKALSCNLQITGDIADSTQLSVDDTATFSFTKCTYDSSLLVDGTIGIKLTKISEDFDGNAPYEIGMDTTLTDFMAENEGSVFTSNGDITMLISENESGDQTAQMSGSSIRVTKDQMSSSHSLILSDYLVDITDGSDGAYSATMQGTLKLSIPFVYVGVDFVTITPFTGKNLTSDTENNPTGGKLHLTDTFSQAWVIAQSDGVNIQIDLDMNRDNVVDETIMTTWAELQDIL
jgi:hypothetical protein